MESAIKSLGVFFILCLIVPQGHAAITSFDPDDNGIGTIAGGPTGPFTVDVTKSYTELGEMALTFSVDSGGIYLINEDIVNNTGIDWTDFHWSVIEEFGNVSIVNVIGIAPFTTINSLPDTQAWLDNGVLAPGQTLVTAIELNVANPRGGLFALHQHPSVPLPASVWLFISAVSGIGLRRRRIAKR